MVVLHLAVRGGEELALGHHPHRTRSLVLRGSRIVAEPLEFDSERVGRLRERVPDAIYSSRESSLTLRAPDADAPETERVERLSQLAEAISASREQAAEAA